MTLKGYDRPGAVNDSGQVEPASRSLTASKGEDRRFCFIFYDRIYLSLGHDYELGKLLPRIYCNKKIKPNPHSVEFPTISPPCDSRHPGLHLLPNPPSSSAHIFACRAAIIA